MMSDQQRELMTESGHHHEQAYQQAFPQSSALSPQSYEINIGELVLHGFEPRDRFAIAEAVTRELDGLLREQDLPATVLGGGDLARLDGGSFEVAPGSRAETIGRQIARAIYDRWRVANEASPPDR